MLLGASGMCRGSPGELIGRLMIDINAGNLENCGIHLLTNISSFFLHVFCIFHVISHIMMIHHKSSSLPRFKEENILKFTVAINLKRLIGCYTVSLPNHLVS
jgi:hypothetical protein